MKFSMQNDILSVSIDSLGAELTSIVSQEHQQEILWEADAILWPRHAPHLFPAVGLWLNNVYSHQNQEFSMIKHGFSRDTEFTLLNQESNRVSFVLNATEETKKCYPWNFSFEVEYLLKDNYIYVTYSVTNNDTTEMFYGIGTHPGFKLHQEISKCALEFSEDEALINQVEFTPQGLLPREQFIAQKTIPITDSLFDQDALIFRNLKSRSIKLNTGSYVLETGWGDMFPVLSLWSPPKAPFVCIEAWAGIADYTDSPKEISQKPYIQSLAPAQSKKYTWYIAIH